MLSLCLIWHYYNLKFFLIFYDSIIVYGPPFDLYDEYFERKGNEKKNHFSSEKRVECEMHKFYTSLRLKDVAGEKVELRKSALWKQQQKKNTK